MDKRLGQDFETLLKQAGEVPSVDEYLKSFSVVIGDMVYARRMQLNLSQQQLAAEAGTTQSKISQIESANGNVGQDILDRVFRVLKLADLTPTYDEQAVAQA
ncbi:helix-turn-helix domain-containing protein [Paenibacillus herberti]|uniref:HTH cro/C1-type domain-containing protein n=1 Tax=Paenibacillus herberti TaxID=1619309 RepID=A0A229NWJ1_9BACL|nr:helix-turn-helix transcriptional regulator [Paenibacillus herberti]OXM14247.1 hypothetical protein CGZ75_14895 [Paenibacillus herberti]